MAERRDRARDDREFVSVFDETSFWCSRFGAVFFRHLELRRGITGLDLGCGTGFPLFEMAHVHGGTCRFVGVDIWDAAIERAAGKLRTYGLGNVSLVQGDGAILPFRDGTFDLIVSNVGVNNFEDLQGVVVECRRVAKTGARLVLTTNPRGHMKELYDAYREVLVGAGKAGSLDRLEKQEGHRLEREALVALAEGAAFGDPRAVEESFEMRFLDGAALFGHWLTRVGFLDGWRSVFDDPAEADEVMRLLERRLDEQAARTGPLTMTIPVLYLELAAV